jgi:hypothetical protein
MKLLTAGLATSALVASAVCDSAPSVPPVYATPNEGDVMSAPNNSRAVEQMAMDYAPGKGYPAARG